jgi:hypothetical protein
VKAYKRETRSLVARFKLHRMSFPKCISALDAALARFIPRMKPDDIDELRAVMLANNEAVMKEVGERGSPKLTTGSRRMEAALKKKAEQDRAHFRRYCPSRWVLSEMSLVYVASN